MLDDGPASGSAHAMRLRLPAALLAALLPACPLLLLGCRSAPPTAAAVPHTPITRAEAQIVLDEQVARWNQGDLPGFVETYWDGPELTFLGSSGITRGRADLLARYQRSYPTAERRGVLRFDVIDFQALGDSHALLLGRFAIAGPFPATGFFSLVLARRGSAIVILHDHTTAAAAKG